jgi:cell shape-determining protein MreC
MAFNAQLQDENESLRQQLTELLNWQQKAFAAHPNIDIDIDRMN